MEYEANRDARNDNQKSSMKALQRDDFSFEFLLYEVPFRVYAVVYGGDMYRKRIVEVS